MVWLQRWFGPRPPSTGLAVHAMRSPRWRAPHIALRSGFQSTPALIRRERVYFALISILCSSALAFAAFGM